MTDQEIFNHFCSVNGLGPREDIENYPHVPVPAAPAYAQTQKVANELIASARAMFPQLLPIHFDFIRDGSVNAYAFRVGNKYFIGMTVGAMAMLHLILDRMLANQTRKIRICHLSHGMSSTPSIYLISVFDRFYHAIRHGVCVVITWPIKRCYSRLDTRSPTLLEAMSITWLPMARHLLPNLDGKVHRMENWSDRP